MLLKSKKNKVPAKLRVRKVVAGNSMTFVKLFKKFMDVAQMSVVSKKVKVKSMLAYYLCMLKSGNRKIKIWETETFIKTVVSKIFPTW